jgi:hypothetical protein
MKVGKTKRVVGLFLASSLLVLGIGCSKEPSEAGKTEAPNAGVNVPTLYQEGAEAYQAGKFTEAMDKFKALAEQGDKQAQFNVGALYHHGEGVAQDDKQAALWGAKAADQGHLDAMDSLGVRYAKGEGVEKDMVQAYKWFSIASLSKHASAASNAKYAATQLTPEQLDQAQNLAKEWMVQHPKQ